MGKQKKNPNKFKKKSFGQKKSFTPRAPIKVERLTIAEITSENSKQTLVLTGIVDRIAQTGGPTIFSLTDGTSTLALKGFLKPGARAYPDIEEGDAISAEVIIDEFNGELEGEIQRIKKLDEIGKQKVLDLMENILKDRAKVEPISFLIKSQILDKLKLKMIEAAQNIRMAIFQNRPVIIRHHNDTDGYSAGFALERAILPLIEEQHSSAKAGWEFYLRAPCSAPFYEIDDSIRDTATSLRNVAKFSNKMPLVIITDNGSTPEDLLGIQHGKIHGMEFIVIDHHYFDKDVISKEVLTHINPFLVGEDGSYFSAGMLSTELARFINPNVENIIQIPALAGLADKIDLMNKKDIDAYVKIAESQGYTQKLLADISTVIDYVSAKVRFMEVREYIGVLFGQPRDKQKDLVELMAPHIRELEEKGLAIAKSTVKTEKINKTTLQILDIDSTFPGFGFYPKPGRCVSLIHDYAEKQKNSNLISIGLMNTAITIRATNEANFSIHELIIFLNKKSPNSFVEGGGHKNAGSISFIPSKKQEILELFKEFIKSRQ